MTGRVDSGSGGFLNSLPGLLVLGVLALGAFLARPPLERMRPVAEEMPWSPYEREGEVLARLWQDPLRGAYEDHERLVRSGDVKGGETRGLEALKPIGAASQWDHVLAVMLRSGDHVDDQENRLRARHAVLSALIEDGLFPEDPEHLRYFMLGEDGRREWRWPEPGKSFLVPYSSHRREKTDATKARPRQSQRVLVLWIDEGGLGEHPLLAIARILDAVPLPDARRAILGPTTSTGLIALCNDYVEWERRGLPEDAKSILDDAVVYSTWATATPDHIEARVEGDPPIIWLQKDPSPGGAALSSGGLQILQVTSSDQELIDLLVDEIEQRTHHLRSEAAHVLLIVEWDTEYGRSLLAGFQRATAEPTGRKLVTEVIPFVRGIDGMVSLERSEAREASRQPETLPVTRALESRNGPSQVDYLRRLEQQIERQFRDTGGGSRGRTVHASGGASPSGVDLTKIAAVGVLGGDVHDKLLILRALRGRFPGAVFFTTDLDAAFLDPEEYPYARNLVVASHFDLTPVAPSPKDWSALDLGQLFDQHGASIRARASWRLSTEALVEEDSNAVEKEEEGIQAIQRELDSRLDARDGNEWKRWCEELSKDEAAAVVGAVHGVFRSTIAGVDNLINYIRFPYRDSYQTSLYLGTLCALKQLQPQDVQLVSRLSEGTFQPRVYEIARHEPIPLDPVGDPAETMRSALVEAPSRIVELFTGRWRGYAWFVAAMAIIYIGVSPRVRASLTSPWRRTFRRVLKRGPGDDAPHPGWDLLAIACQVMIPSISLLFLSLAATDAEHGGEPLRFLDGVSIWPSLFLRSFGVLVAGAFVFVVFREFEDEKDDERASLKDIEKSGGPTLPPVTRGGEPRYIIHEYRDWSSRSRQVRNAVALTVVFFLPGAYMLHAAGPVAYPTRGLVNHLSTEVVNYAFVCALLFLTFLVFSFNWTWVGFSRKLMDEELEWPPSYLEEYGSKHDLPKEIVRHSLPMEIMAANAKRIEPLVYYPGILLFVMIFSRSTLFDKWTWPTSVIVVITANALFLIATSLVLRKNIRKAREKVLERLEDLRVEMRWNSASKLERTITRIEADRRGPLGPITRTPAIRYLMIPFASFGSLPLAEWFVRYTETIGK